jgi:hypothetical protein
LNCFRVRVVTHPKLIVCPYPILYSSKMDPLNINPSWSTSPPRTPRTASYLSHARNKSAARPASPIPSIPASSPFIEPKVFGAPGMGLANPDASGSGPMSPRKDKGKEGPFLRVRIGVLERNRKDLLIRFDANVSRY